MAVRLVRVMTSTCSGAVSQNEWSMSASPTAATSEAGACSADASRKSAPHLIAPPMFPADNGPNLSAGCEGVHQSGFQQCCHIGGRWWRAGGWSRSGSAQFTACAPDVGEQGAVAASGLQALRVHQSHPRQHRYAPRLRPIELDVVACKGGSAQVKAATGRHILLQR